MREGTIVADRFVVLRHAGEGGTADVFEATDLLKEVRVALKMMRPDAIDAARFAREGAILGGVRHASVVRYVAHGALPDGRAYLALRWVDGETLAARLHRGAIDPLLAVRIVISAARTLGDLHAVGVVHRDVKPANLMIRAGTDDDVVLMDFGLARGPSTHLTSTHAGAFLGTPAYVAPEQIGGGADIDPRADVYSLGAVLYECLAGRAVFTGDGAVAVLAKVALESPAALASLRPDLPRALTSVVDRALRKSRHERPSDGAALAEELATVFASDRRDSVPPPRAEVRVRRSEAPRSASAVLGRPTTYVGRAKELGLLGASYAACVEDSSARAILMTAPAGYGKTRLYEELLTRLAATETPPNVIVAAAEAPRARTALALVGTIVRRAIGVADGSEAAAVAALERYASARGADDAPRTIALLRELLAPRVSYATPDPTTSRDDAWLAHERTRAGLRVCLENELAIAPLVLVLDDLHWADAASVRLIDVMLEQLRDRPLLVFALARPDIDQRFPSLWGGRNVLRVQIDALTPRDAESLVREVLGDAAQPESLRRIVHRAGGNALFLEELSRVRARGDARGEAMPDSILAILKARLDALDPRVRRVLGAASVIGETFAVDAVTAALADVERGDVLARLERLVVLELVQASAEPDAASRPRFAFRHALIAEAAYALVPTDERKRAHLAVAEWLEANAPSDATVIAEHFERAGHEARAATWLACAGQEALRAQEPQPALEAFARARAAKPPRPLLGSIRAWEGQALGWLGDWPGAERCLDDALDLLDPGDPLRPPTLAGLILSATFTGQGSHVVRGIAELRALRARGESSTAFALTGFLIALTLCTTGQRAMARELCAPLLAAPESSDARERGWMALCRGLLGEVCDGLLAAPLDAYRAASALFASTGSSFALGMAQRFEGRVLIAIGAWAEAHAKLTESLHHIGRIGGGTHVSLTRNLLAWSALGVGRLDEGMRIARATADEFERAGNPVGLGQSTTILAIGALIDAKLVDAEAFAARSDETQLGLPVSRAHALVVRAQIAVARGRVDDARRFIATARELFDAAGGWAYTEAPLLLTRARVLHLLGDADGERDAVRTLARRVAERAEGLNPSLARVWRTTLS